MRQAEHILLEGREAFGDALLKVLACCRREIMLVDRDLQAWPFETPENDRALVAALRRGARLRVLVADAAWLERHGTRFMRTRRVFDGRIECRRLSPALRVDESALLGDRQHLLRRLPGERLRGRCAIASPTEAEPLAARLDAAWEECDPCLPSTVLGLMR
ncbi:hypothetical protein [Quisquiliibacterium transsilvanicum]|uniref:DUF7931 domain-containing protein n=1 Tax=Quisquiliibacterium transsilvanicum TaxID=1549638 RepID=A0A7W8HKD9_9BURK|nr:hypothetical protein [Quisquiliibacterium transsilvanicum]MBB5273699.1 hypothetical protein [Quisquiliibacterium transsilvanicum]